jgi:hypothetical protein
MSNIMNPLLLTYLIGVLISFAALFLFLKSCKDLYYEQDKDEMDLPFGSDDDKPRKVNKRNVLFTIIGAILWPLTLLIVIFGVIIQLIVEKRQTKKYEVKARQKALEAKKKEQQRMDAFNNSIPSDNPTDIDECVALWKQIVALTDAKQYAKLTECLSEINVAAGYTLNVSLCKTPQDDEDFNGIGSDSYLYVADKDGKQEWDIFKFITVTNSEKGAWQAFVLHELWHILPHYWHGIYNYRTFVFDKQDLQKVLDSVYKIPHTYDAIDGTKYDVRPQITTNGHNYFVSYCFWNNWEGLVREVVEITIIDGKVTETNNLSKKVEFQYDCGIVF